MELILENIKKLFIGENEKKEDKMDTGSHKETINKNDIHKVINYCSRCGGNHFDLSCIYSKN